MRPLLFQRGLLKQSLATWSQVRTEHCEDHIQHEFLNINGVSTRILTFGRWVEDSSNTDEIVLIIPGSPGVTSVYKQFMQKLFEKIKCPIWIIGHAGHEIPYNTMVPPVPNLKGNEQLFGLQGQIDHKLEFFNKYIPRNSRVHLIGHSIGSYISLELLKHANVKSRVIDLKLLFSVFEHVAETPRGQFYSTYIKRYARLILLFSRIYKISPMKLRQYLTNKTSLSRLTGSESIHLQSVIDFFHPAILEKVFYMAFEILDQIEERNNTVIKENLDKITLFYGDRDRWVPIRYYNRMIIDFPGIKAHIVPFDHDFMLFQSRQVAELVANSILTK